MVVFHVDANSAYLSWTAAQMRLHWASLDIREAPAVIAGDPEERHGIILAKSIPAAACGISTGESLFSAKQKCPELLVFPPDYDLYLRCSQAMYEILREYSPVVQRYSIDECFVDFTHSRVSSGGPRETAEEIRRRIRGELGFTVNIGVAENKLLAKMAGELKKPDMVHTLWPGELAEKLWPLPVRKLFMVGPAAEAKLKKINIRTIGDLARADRRYLRTLLKSHGDLIWRYANGIDADPVIPNEFIDQKGMGNSITLSYDMTERRELLRVLLALCERLGMRLRKGGWCACVAEVSFKTSEFAHCGHQKKLSYMTDSTTELFQEISGLFQQRWRGEPIRQLGVGVSRLVPARERQLSLFRGDEVREQRMNAAVDEIRRRFGERLIMRGAFANSGVTPLLGGINDGKYIVMGGYEQ